MNTKGHEWMKGEKNCNYGGKITRRDEIRRKISESHKKLYANGYVNPLAGKKRDDLRVRNMENNPMKNASSLEKARKSIRDGYRSGRRVAKSGEECHAWRGGVTPLQKRVRDCTLMKEWRQKIISESSGYCGICSEPLDGKIVEADHYPVNFVEIFKSLVDRNNGEIDDFEYIKSQPDMWEAKGRAVCKDCHRSTNQGRATRGAKR